MHIAAYTFCIMIQSQASSLHYAAQTGDISVVEYLIKCGADVNAVLIVSCFLQYVLYHNTEQNYVHNIHCTHYF